MKYFFYPCMGLLLVWGGILMAEPLEVGSKALSHVEVISSPKNFNPSPDDFRIYFIGDSITRHGVNKNTIEKLKWSHIAGMAASSQDKDYAHLVAKAIGTMLPKRKVKMFFGAGNNAKRALTGMPIAAKYRPDLVIVQLGEHEKPNKGTDSIHADYEKLLDALLAINPRPLIICTGVWAPQTGKQYVGNAKIIEDIQEQLCKAKGIPFASVQKYALDQKCSGSGETRGVQWHPNDLGQAGYATEILKLFRPRVD